MSSVPKDRPTRRTAFSLFEVLVCLAIIGVLTAVAIPVVGKLIPDTRAQMADAMVQNLNRAAATFKQSIGPISTAASVPGSTAEEKAVYWLVTRDPAVPGSPYFQGNYPKVVTDDVKNFRVKWNGQFFQVIPAGTAGSGLRIDL